MVTFQLKERRIKMKLNAGSIGNMKGECIQLDIQRRLRTRELVVGIAPIVFGVVYLINSSWKQGIRNFTDQEYQVQCKLGNIKDDPNHDPGWSK